MSNVKADLRVKEALTKNIDNKGFILRNAGVGFRNMKSDANDLFDMILERSENSFGTVDEEVEKARKDFLSGFNSVVVLLNRVHDSRENDIKEYEKHFSKKDGGLSIRERSLL